MEINQSRSPALHPPIAPKELMVSKDVNFDRKKISLNRALFLCRFLLTKRLVRREHLDEIEEFSLCDLLYQVLSTTDTKFVSKNVETLLVFKLIFKQKLYCRTLETYQECQLEILLKKNILLSPRAFLGQELNLEKELYKRINRRLRKTPPPQRFIGVGYRDKGNARISHHDGTPSWQEVVGASPDAVRKDFASERGPQTVRSSRNPATFVTWDPL